MDKGASCHPSPPRTPASPEELAHILCVSRARCFCTDRMSRPAPVQGGRPGWSKAGGLDATVVRDTIAGATVLCASNMRGPLLLPSFPLFLLSPLHDFFILWLPCCHKDETLGKSLHFSTISRFQNVATDEEWLPTMGRLLARFLSRVVHNDSMQKE